MDHDSWRASIEERLAPLCAAPGGNLSFHAMMLTGDGRSLPSTSWVGWADGDCRVELRVAEVVDARFAFNLHKVGVEPLFVVDVPGLLLFLVAGGAALIERSVAEGFFPELLEPVQSVRLGRSGFVVRSQLPDAAFRRAPDQKLRMAVLKRDGFRCAVCGRRPADNVDVELEVHHIRPWGFGGVTHEANLLTLCRTCHRGLDPHFEHALFDFVDAEDAACGYRNFERSTLAYRDRIDRQLALL